MATKTASSRPTFALPDGKPVTADQVEADLRARVATCERALEDALRQLARLCSLMGRQAEAMSCVERCLATDRDRAQQAAGCLGLGQLLEQRDRYAEAEAMYARGQDMPRVRFRRPMRANMIREGRRCARGCEDRVGRRSLARQLHPSSRMGSVTVLSVAIGRENASGHGLRMSRNYPPAAGRQAKTEATPRR